MNEINDIATQETCVDCKEVYYVPKLKNRCMDCYTNNEFKTFVKSLQLKPIKKSFWNNLKEYSFMALLTIPLLFTINLIYGFKIQLIVIAAFILGQLSSPIVDWLMRKF